MSKSELPPSEGLYPVPVVLVSCLDKKSGKSNIITIAWCGVACSKPPLLSVSIRPSRHSHAIIKDNGDFVINIPTGSILEKVDLCGACSGRDTDKFKACRFTAVPSTKISSPIIKECPVNIECVLRDTIRLGAHDMFIGEVVAIHADDDVIGSGHRIDYERAQPIVFNQGEYWNLGEKIGLYGCSSR